MVSESINSAMLPLPKRNAWGDYVIQPLLLTIMVASVSISIIALGRGLAPDWWGGHLLIGMVLAAVEAIYSFRITTHPRSRGISLTRFRLAELGTLAILLKIVTYIGQPWAEIWLSVATFIRQPGAFFSLDYILILILALLAWAATYGTMVDFEALYDPFTFRSERIPALDKLAARFYWGGGLLIIFSGLSLLVAEKGVIEGVTSLADLNRPGIGGVVVNALVYFVLGLVMLSQMRLTTLLTRWHIQQVNVAEGLGRQWARYGLIFLAVVGLVVIFLPTGYSLGVFASAQYVVALLANVAVILMQILALLITIPFSWLARLFGSNAPPPAAPGGIGPPPVAPAALGEAPPWGEILRSLLFWVTFALIAFYLIRAYLADHPELLGSLKRFTPLRWLFGILATLFVWLIQLIRSGVELIPKRVELKPQAKTARSRSRRWRIPRLGAGSDRERILYYYLNILQRAENMGLIRQRYQTPYEFEPQLSSSVPEVESEVDFLTDAFVHARYSRDEFDSEHAALVKTVWERIRSALREAKKQRHGRENRPENGG